ncbi:MAG TPA: tetratricopeptide repeat protein [Cyclobacteriaceae bacterium]|nr:tetratricopeptide repeat protein [Cyclobacteriaceae bacterium]
MSFRVMIVAPLLLLLSFPAAAQTAFSDSLDVALKNQPDSLQRETLIAVFNKYSATNYTRARTAGYKAMPLMRQLSGERLADFLMRIGQTEYTYGNHEEALKLYLESADIYKKMNKPASEASLYNEIAVLHRKNKNMQQAKAYINSALELYKIAYDTNGLATTLNNLGITNEIEGNPEIALDYYRQALSLYTAYKCKLCVSYSLDYMADAFNTLLQFDSALYYGSKSLVLRRELGNTYTIAQSLMTFGEIHFKKENYKEAIGYFLECAGLCRKINFKDYERRSYEYLSKCYERTGNFKEAYRYQITYTQINDSLFNETRSKQISELQILYETEVNESKIREFQQEQVTRNYILFAVVAFLILLSVTGIVLYRQQRLKNALTHERTIKETEESERLRIAKDIHDDLGSGLSKIYFLSQELLYKNAGEANTKNMTSVIEISGNLIENMRDLVWELNAENTTLDNLIASIREHSTDYLEDTPIAMISSYPAEIPRIPLGKVVYRNIFMTVKEILNNIVKHSKANHVHITVGLSNDQLSISVHDDGVGFDSSAVSGGNGLTNIKSRILSIGGIPSIMSEGTGTRIALAFNLNQMGKSQILL